MRASIIIIMALAVFSLAGCDHAGAGAAGLAHGMPGGPGIIAAAAATAGTAEHVIAEDSAVFGERVARRAARWARELSSDAEAALARLPWWRRHGVAHVTAPSRPGESS